MNKITISTIMDCSFRLRKSLEKRSESICKKYDLKFIELEILSILMDGNCGDTASQIGHNKHISKAHLSKSLDRLHQKGYIYFDKDTLDHRFTHIVLSDQAVSAAKEMNEIKANLEKKLLNGFSESEKLLTKKLFQNLTDNMTKIEMSGS
ncbi:MAG: hypothetical protein J6E46_12695 [Faecalicoccus sp.]|nr:hypothetical protein [Faecalicoccus sp.]